MAHVQRACRNTGLDLRRKVHAAAAAMETPDNPQGTQQLDRQSPGQPDYLKSAQRWRSHRRGLGEIRCLEPWTPRSSECAAGKDPDISIQSLGDSSRAASIGCPRGPLAWHTWPYNGHFCWVVMPNCFDSFIYPLSSLFSLSLPVIFTEYLQLSC